MSNLPSLRAMLSACVVDVADWCAARRLSLNASKTELIWFGSRHNLSKMSNLELYITAGSDKITPTSVVRDLGVMLDSELSMKQHVAKVASLCYYHLRRIRQIRRRVGLDRGGDTTCRGPCPVTTGLLQCCACRATRVNDGATSACSKLRRPSSVLVAPARSCKAIPPETTLAPCDLACQVQALPTYVQVIAWFYSDIHR